MKVPITTFAFLVQNYSLYQLIQSLEEQKPQMNTKRDSQLIIHAFLRLLSMPIPDLFDRIAGELPLIGNLLNFHALQIHKLDHGKIYIYIYIHFKHQLFFLG